MQIPIITLCGSTKFKETFELWQIRLSLAGFPVYSIGCASQSDASLKLTTEDKHHLDLLHLRKIALSNAILVLNVTGYVGESTQREIDWARHNDKQIFWLEGCGRGTDPIEVDDMSKEYPVDALDMFAVRPLSLAWNHFQT